MSQPRRRETNDGCCVSGAVQKGISLPAISLARHSTRPIAGRDRTWADSLRDREPALLLLHLDLLRDADGVLCVGLRHGAAIHGLALQRTYGCAEVEDMRRLGLLGSVFRRDPVHDILTSGVFRVLRRRSHRGGVRGDLLRLGGDVRRTGCGRLPRLNLGRARVHVLGVLLDRWGVVADPDQRRDHGQYSAHAAGNLLGLADPCFCR